MLDRRQFMLALAVGACALPLRAQTTTRSIHRVEIKNFAYEPSRIEVRVGDIIEWINLDIDLHTATADDNSWSTSSLDGKATSRLVMTRPGAIVYHCTYHPQMKGMVMVAS